MNRSSCDPQNRLDTPCVGICTMGGAGVCTGCGRTLAQIASWSNLSPSARLAIMEELTARKTDLSRDSLTFS
jgi:predicted Fe-S protein YdhL (DUF1289 family)